MRPGVVLKGSISQGECLGQAKEEECPPRQARRPAGNNGGSFFRDSRPWRALRNTPKRQSPCFTLWTDGRFALRLQGVGAHRFIRGAGVFEREGEEGSWRGEWGQWGPV